MVLARSKTSSAHRQGEARQVSLAILNYAPKSGVSEQRRADGGRRSLHDQQQQHNIMPSSNLHRGGNFLFHLLSSVPAVRLAPWSSCQPLKRQNWSHGYRSN